MAIKAKDEIGKIFGRLTVIKRSYPNSKGGEANWFCKCECGKQTIVRGNNLRSGKTQSCGCYGKERVKKRLNPGLARMRAIIESYKRNAKKRRLNFELTEEQFSEITKKDCFYCGAKPNNVSKTERCNGKFTYNGIDRVDNTKGYTIDNVVPCCIICNQAKSNLTTQEYKDWIKKVYNYCLKEVMI